MENQQSSSTASAILEAGKKEFLTFGYEKASLRRIAAEASVTTGAIYGCFSGKEAIFEALTGEVSQTLVDMYTNVHREFAVLSPEKQVEELSGITSHHVLSMINYIYDHFDEFKLLLCCGAPGSAEAFIARLAGVEEQSCFDFVEAAKAWDIRCRSWTTRWFISCADPFFSSFRSSSPMIFRGRGRCPARFF